jgi:hypothetical protein
MTQVIEAGVPDAMQVCRNGHVITDRLHLSPEVGWNRCERCGAATLHCCPTCGWKLPGAICIPGLSPIGVRQPPRYCSNCGAAFPWAVRRQPLALDSVSKLEKLLRRLPHVIRQLRSRHGNRPPFRVEDERDLEDLLRAILPLHFDDIRPQSCTPSYASATRTDFLLAPERIVLTVKCVGPLLREPQLAEQMREDVVHWSKERTCRTLIGFVYDPEAVLRDALLLEAAWSVQEDGWEARCVITTP